VQVPTAGFDSRLQDGRSTPDEQCLRRLQGERLRHDINHFDVGTEAKSGTLNAAKPVVVPKSGSNSIK
jgi:hypothetical protein